MHSASTRFNGITLFTFSVLAVMCLINFTEGYFLFNPRAEVEFKIDTIPNFINTTRWDQASLKYSMQAGTYCIQSRFVIFVHLESQTIVRVYRMRVERSCHQCKFMFEVGIEWDHIERLDLRTSWGYVEIKVELDFEYNKWKDGLFTERCVSFFER